MFSPPPQHQHPFISAMVNNGSLTYDHDRDGTLTQIAGCEAKFRNVEHDTHLSIQYLNNKLIVRTDMENKNEWKLCFEANNVQLPTGYYFGASATTGDLSDNHDIITFKFYEIEPLADVSVRATRRLADRMRPNTFHLFEQHATLLERMHLVPSAETAEAPRERKDDIKPGTSNVKVISLPNALLNPN